MVLLACLNSISTFLWYFESTVIIFCMDCTWIFLWTPSSCAPSEMLSSLQSSGKCQHLGVGVRVGGVVSAESLYQYKIFLIPNNTIHLSHHSRIKVNKYLSNVPTYQFYMWSLCIKMKSTTIECVLNFSHKLFGGVSAVNSFHRCFSKIWTLRTCSFTNILLIVLK